MKTTILSRDPGRTLSAAKFRFHEEFYPGLWPARWVHHPKRLEKPFVTAYRLRLQPERATKLDLHVTADERYALYLDGELLGRGPERGDPANWFFETYRLDLSAAPHTLVAIVWSLGHLAPGAQTTVAPGLFVCCLAPSMHSLVSTGEAPWEVTTLDGYSVARSTRAFLAGGLFTVDLALLPNHPELGEGDGWVAVEPGPHGKAAGTWDKWGGGSGHKLRPATLPSMIDEPIAAGIVRHADEPAADDTRGVCVRQAQSAGDQAAQWQALLAGTSPVTVPPHSRRRVIIDLDNYFCAYWTLSTSGGAGSAVRVSWAEGLYELADCGDHTHKGNRDIVEGKFFGGVEDWVLPDGSSGRRAGPLWWRAGRFIEILVRTGDQPLTISAFDLRETRYPLHATARFACDEPRMESIAPMMTRSLQMCAHETFFDCPYYEQLMYVGDTRLEVLLSYMLTSDSRLVRKALDMFRMSRQVSGLTMCRYPGGSPQIIPGFSLWWCAMVHDYAMYRGDRAFVAGLMPAVHGVLEAFLCHLGDDNLVRSPDGWNFMDWTRADGWVLGAPPGCEPGGVSAMLNWQLALVLGQVAQLDAWLGEPEMATRWRRQARAIATATDKRFWDSRRKLYRDDARGKSLSEHTQCLAILSGLAPKAHARQALEQLVNHGGLIRTTIYFSHYLFETLYRSNRMDALFERLHEWFALAGNGMRTTRENPEPTRSDCHAWGAHPLYHYYASFAGIRPDGFGFTKVVIEPQLGPLGRVSATIPHPSGTLRVEFHRDGPHGLRGKVVLPKGVTGTIRWRGRGKALKSGVNFEIR